MLSSIPLNDISWLDIQSLIDDKVAESINIEYKEKLPSGSDESKREFLYDFSSFANASGGQIIFGLSAERDANNKCTGMPKEIIGIGSINQDKEYLRMEGMIRSCIEPRVPAYHMRIISSPDESKSVLIIRIPPSYQMPHMVKIGDNTRFYSRNNSGKYMLDVAELRSKFLMSEGRSNNIKRFREERISKIIAGDTPISLLDGPKMVLHLVPLIENADFQLSAAKYEEDLTTMYANCSSIRFNIDGLLKFYQSSTSCAYIQIFRNGAIEVTESAIPDPEMIIGNQEENLLYRLRTYLGALVKLGIESSFILMFSLINIRHYRYGYQRYHGFLDPKIDRDYLLLPDVIIEPSDKEIDRTIRPIFDMLWQASGYDQSPNYDNTGRHKTMNNQVD